MSAKYSATGNILHFFFFSKRERERETSYKHTILLFYKIMQSGYIS